MEVIIFESEAYNKLRAEMLAEVRSFLSDLLAQKNKQVNNVWLSPEEARQLVGLKSRNSMKKLRESGVIHYAKIGREFRYDKKSLEDFIVNKSTKRYTIITGKKKNKEAIKR